MKSKILKIFTVLVCIAMLFCGCSHNSGIAIGKVESSTRTRIMQSHLLLNGTEVRTLSIGKEAQEMEAVIVTKEGEIDITITDKNGEEILVLEDAETGTYEFIAEGKIKITVKAKDHHGSFEIKKANS